MFSLQTNTQKASLLSFISFIVSVFFFLPASRSGMVHDFTGFFLNMEQGTWSEALGSFEYDVVQPFLQTFNLLLFKVAGRNSAIYFLLFHLLFSLGIFAWTKFLLEFTKSLGLTFGIVGFFVLSPYIVEVLVYDVCQAYLISFILLGFYHFQLLKYLRPNGRKALLLLIVVLLLQLWTFDLILIYLPLTVLFYFLSASGFERRKWLRILLVNVVFVSLYFVENRLFLGAWVGHYGAQVHLNFDILAQGATMLKYFVKHIGFGQFWTYSIRHSVYEAVAHPATVVGFFLVSLSLTYYFMRRKRSGKLGNLALYFFLASLVSLLPVSNLSFPDLMLTENDRYGFMFEFFIGGALLAVVFQIRSKILTWALVGFFFIGQFFTQRTVITAWSEGQSVVNAVLSEWPSDFYDSQQDIYLLNLPDNYHGVYLFKNLYKGSELFEETFLSQKFDTTFAQFHVVAQMNMSGLTDGASAEVIDSGEIQVSVNQYGTWWWRNANGAYSYNAEDYSMTLDGLTYVLARKEKPLKCYIWDDSRWVKVPVK